MSTWNIYHKDGSKLTDVNGEQITVHGLEYSDSWMGECFVTINLKHEVPINFQIGDYIVYRGERFELNYEPGKDKQARPDTYGEGFVYDSVKFNALQDELSRAEFLDVVLNDNELHYTTLPKFPFYVQTLDDLLDRIQANLDDQIGTGLWKIYSRSKERSVQRGCLVSDWQSMYGEGTNDNVIESMSITVDSQTCWQALALVNEKWDINFIVRGRNIYVGTTGIQANHIFKYGLGNGLYEIVQNADSDQSVITRLRAYGSEKNLPSHYYADLGVKYVANITKVVTATTYVDLNIDIDYVETYFKNKRKYGESQEQSFGWVLQVTFDFQTIITGYVTQAYDSKKCRFYSELKGTQTDTGDEVSKEKLDAFIAQVNAGNTKMYITSGLNKKNVPSSMKEYAENLPNNMSINRLMLPGFPHVSLSDFYDSLTEQEKKYVNPTGKQHRFSTDPHRPYIDSININQIGLRSASQFFDTDDKTNGVVEIYPTIEEMEIGGVRVDEINEGVAPDDDGRFGDNETVKNVDIYLKKAIDFDINDLKDDDFSISMKDGMCGGRTFKVASSAKIDGRWRLTIERVKDDALELWFPYKDYPIKNGDHFVLTGITLPDSYVNAASLKLLKYAIAFIDKNDYTRYVYQPKVDEIFMARQHDLAEKDTTGVIKSLHDTLKAGDLMEFEDTDLRIGGVISIDQLTIKEEDGKIPTYDITLREDKEVGTIQKIQQQISSLQSGNGGTGAGLTTTQVKNQVATEGSKHFISKINDDIANGTITWEKVQKFLQGLLVGGGSWTPDAEGRSHLITDYLEVRMKAIFEELVINKTSTIGGKEIISPAGGMVAHKVEEVTVTYNNVSQKAYRCYFLAEQDGDAVDNDFAVGDQVRSESFNVRKGTYHKAGNHFYWRLAIGRNEEPVELEGKKYHYIDLSDIDCATASDVPAKGDVLNQCGNRTDVERQNCLIFSAVDTYSPSISLYHGINSYSFANKEYVEYGVNKQTNKAFFNVYGDMYVGDRPTKENGYEGSSYIKYDSAAKQVSVKGKISAKSTVDGKELSQYIKENSAKGLTEEQVNNLIKNSQVITDLQNQVDGAIETWFYEGVPTLKNAPASSWATDKEKDTHLGDLYYDNKTGKAYRFAKDGNTYKWTIITDTDIAKALSDASKAQETADGKMKVFSTQPNPPYQVGDIWVNATYPADGSTYKNEVLRCQTAKGAGSQFAIGDWIKASKYTDDTVANAAQAAAEKAQKAAEKAQGDISKLGTTVTTNKKDFDSYVTDGYLEPSEIAAMAQDSKRLEDAFAAAEKSYNEVKGAEVLKSTKELTDLNTAFTTLSTAKTELVTYLSDISTNYNKADTNGKAAIVSAVGTKFTNFQSAYSAFYDKLGLANAYITSKIYGDLKQNITDLAGYKYLKDALGQTTHIDGGLVMTTLLALRDGDGNVQSGINGAIDTNRGKKSIATWWGGQMVDKDYNSGNLTPATSLIRFDGSGYLANGAIWWDVSGKVHADPTSFIISEKNLGAYLTFFEPTWKEGSAGTSVADLVSLKPNAPFSKLGVSGDATFEGAISFHGIKLTYDSKNKAIKIDGNLYTTGGITAYGAGASTTGGGGLIASVISYARIIEGNYTDADLTSIPNAYAIKALSSRIDNIASELGGLSLSWNNITGKPSTFTPSAHTHKWTEITDRITKVSQLTNDKGYLTAHQSLASYYTKAEIDAKGYTTNKGTVTSVALTLPTGLTCATKTITTSGTFAISLASGYSIPTTAKQTAWDGAVSAKHTHSNKSVLDGITSTKVTCWDSAYDWYALITTDEETADGVINKWNEVVSFLANIAQTDTLSGIVDGINKSISDEVTRAKKAEGVNASGISTNKTSITTLQGYFTSGSAKKALQLTNTRKLWGNSFNGTADINGSIIVPDGKYISIGNIKMEYDAANKALKITNTTTEEVANLYTSGGVSAYGVGASSSSGGGFNGSVKAYADAIRLTTENLSEIASAYSVAKLYSEIQNVASAVPSISVSVPTGGNALTGATYDASTGVITFAKGTFLTAHQSLDGYVNAIAVSGSGNAVTAVTKSGKTITFTKGATYLTSHQSLSNYYTKSSVDSLLSGKSATSHTHSVKINGVTKTIAATGGTAVDLGTYLTSHQSLANYVTIHDSRLTDSRYPKFANNTWYLVGDDAYIGDHNIGGTFCIKSANNDSVAGIALYNTTENKYARLWFDNKNINLDHQLVMNNNRIWIQGVGTAGGNNNRLTLVAGMPSGLAYNTSCRGTILYSNGIAFADPYNGNSNNDSGWIRHLETSANSGTLEIAVGDDASNEQIHFRWYNTNSSAETIAHDITVPRATGTLALTSQIPTTLPANGGNSDTVDGYHASGLLTALSNSDKGISITVGGTTKSVSNISVNYASSAGNADTVDGYHESSFLRYRGGYDDASVTKDGVGVYGWAHTNNGHNNFHESYGDIINIQGFSTWRTRFDIGTSGRIRIMHGINTTTATQVGYLAYLHDNVASATKLQTPRSIWGQSFDGTGNVNGTIYINNNNSSNGAIRLNNDISANARISAIDDQVIFNTGNAIRFGETSWDWNQWAGLKYTHSDKTIYLGIADGSAFNANSPQNDGTLKFPGITTITPDGGARIGGSGGDLYLGNANNSNWVKVQDICSHNGSNYWYIYQNGNAHFNNIGLTGATINGTTTINGTATINGNLSVTGLISNKGILPANYEVNNKGTSCYVSADALCSGITAITDSIQVNQVTVQYSNDSGNSWTNYSMNNDAKFNLYASNAGLTQVYLGYNVITGNNDAEKLAQVKKNELMVTFEISNNCYSQVYFASVDISSGIDTICTIETLNNSGAVVGTYTKHITGWNQINYIYLSPNGNAGYSLGSNSNRYIRFKFKHDQKTTALRNAAINKIRIFSFTKYSFPTDRFMGHTGHIYNFDYNMNTYFPNSILAKGGVTAYQSSDIRLKQDLRKLDYLGIIKAMGGTYGFAWKKDNTRSIGWIAQHVLCNPHLKDIVETDEKGYYKINYWSPKLIATAFGAIEQVGDEVSRLKARVVFLESEVQRLSGDKEDCNKKRLDNKNINSLN